jgi:hypothetical protein
MIMLMVERRLACSKDQGKTFWQGLVVYDGFWYFFRDFGNF